MLMTCTNNYSRTALRTEQLFYFVCVEADAINTKLLHSSGWHLKYNSNKTFGGFSSNSDGEDFVTSNFIFTKMV